MSLAEQIERGLEFAGGVRVAGLGADVYAALVNFAGLVNQSKFLECLAAVVIRSYIFWIDIEQFSIFFHCLRIVSGACIRHSQAVAREAVAWILRHHVLQNFEPVLCHPCATIPRWRAPILSR